ncbi:MAG: hypothetical protein Q9178_007975 [Gyalolechia marmorata]
MPDFIFPYHMTRSSLGLIFSSYEYRSVLQNDIIEQTLVEAAQKINHQLASHPNLANQALDDEWVYVQEEHEYLLGFVPDIPKMTNFPKMPGRTFPYHMTPDKLLGLIFTHYDYGSTFDNEDIEQALVGAAHQIDQEITDNPTLANQTLDLDWAYEHNPLHKSEDYYYLTLQPNVAAMTYGDIPTVIAVLATWATQYRTVETDFEIWTRPGTGEQRRLGFGMLLFII